MIQEKLNILIRWTASLALVNLLWLIFSVAGLFIVGFFPSTMAMLAVVRRWVLHEKVSIFQNFLLEFKIHFVKANIFGWSLSFIGLVLFLDYQMLMTSEFTFQWIIVFSFFITLFFYMLILINIFPVHLHFDAPWYINVRTSVLIGILNLPFIVGLALFAGIVFYFIFAFPIFILFFSGSLIAYAQMWIVINAMNRLERKKKGKLLKAI